MPTRWRKPFDNLPIGFPITLIFGLLIVLLGLPSVQTAFVGMMREAFAMIGSLQTAGG